MSIIPILFGVVCGYVFAAIMGIVNFQPVIDAPWFQVPHFYAPVFDINAIMIIAPAALVVLAEHIGHLVVTGNIVDRDLIKDPACPVLYSPTAFPMLSAALPAQLRTLPMVKTSALWQLPRFTAPGLSAALLSWQSSFPSAASSAS